MKTNTTKFVLSVAAYLVLSMIVVSLWHFAFFKEHYASINIVRTEPLMQLGVITMTLRGCVLALLFPFYNRQATGTSIGKGIKFGVLMGIFLGTYLSLAEPGKYMIPDVSGWIAIEGSLSVIQFVLVGCALGIINSETYN